MHCEVSGTNQLLIKVSAERFLHPTSKDSHCKRRKKSCKNKNWFSNFSKSRVTSGCGAISQNIIAILGLVVKAGRADFFVFNATDRS